MYRQTYKYIDIDIQNSLCVCGMFLIHFSTERKEDTVWASCYFASYFRQFVPRNISRTQVQTKLSEVFTITKAVFRSHISKQFLLFLLIGSFQTSMMELFSKIFFQKRLRHRYLIMAKIRLSRCQIRVLGFVLSEAALQRISQEKVFEKYQQIYRKAALLKLRHGMGVLL